MTDFFFYEETRFYIIVCGKNFSIVQNFYVYRE